MDFNLLVGKLNGIDDERLRDSMIEWVSLTMLPAVVEHNVSLNMTEDIIIDCYGTGVGGYFSEGDEPVQIVGHLVLFTMGRTQEPSLTTGMPDILN